MSAKRCLNPNCAEYALRKGYDLAIMDLLEVLDEVLTMENIEAVKAIRERMTHYENIRIETDFTLPA